MKVRKEKENSVGVSVGKVVIVSCGGNRGVISKTFFKVFRISS
jgi:hypothetical protein